ncbi:MAG: hypothetical protein COU08_00725 [Candidatus Harrisonbacteria bacterium CG10_big_fil_rev_8_21_14_0_10_42_17]|uniref:Metallo-beta-lactamase domain-containing protein n=1 Tax=Candidatus Harrisonbacteria bacterium CG10_big_fil_rev_8_21_14_0_10_42_17 TaxID=1974584 RepID=A0A2M6WJ13_9BACT|nr:MAG: hypothetical protein COU08_00725 [Candidatus Harrisonbacteria bacterium CG10_big_fil_rev_8_21_14_0_10_42_17]
MHKAHRFVVIILVSIFLFDGYLWFRIFSLSHGETKVYFFDVGQGDSGLVVLPNNVQLLIDGGRDAAVLSNLSRVMDPTDRTIEMLMMTHPDTDHFGGLIDVLERYHVALFLGTGRIADSEVYQRLHDVLIERNIPYLFLQEGDLFSYGDVVFTVLGPSSQELLSDATNDTSLVVLMQKGEKRVLFTADIGFQNEERLVRDYDLSADILKIAHHGSRFSTSDAFLAELQPSLAVINVGENRYGHPHADVLDRLSTYSIPFYRTDQDGIVEIDFTEDSFRVFTQN